MTGIFRAVAGMLVCVCVAACRQETTVEQDAGTAGNGGSGGNSGCQVSCASGERCSATGDCIPEGTCRVKADCDENFQCVDQHCTPGSGCGGVELAVERVPSSLVLSVDRSCSMRQKVNGKPKWEWALAALRRVAEEHAGGLTLGLNLWPDRVPEACVQSGANHFRAVPDAGPQLLALLDGGESTTHAFYPNDPCVTNLENGFREAAADPALLDPAHSNHVLLMTDGAQGNGCTADGGGDKGTARFIESARTTQNLKTWVVGFGAAADVPALNLFAAAGGTALDLQPDGGPIPDGGIRFRTAETGAELAEVFAAVARAVKPSCVYALKQAPSDPNNIFVYFNDSQKVLRDTSHASGWDLEPGNTVLRFWGPACEALESGSVKDLDVVFGCDAPQIN